MRSALLATSLVLSMAAPALVTWSCSARLPGPEVCDSRHPCEKGQRCVLGRCRAEKATVVSVGATRLVFTPQDVGFRGRDGAREMAELGDTIVLGQRGEGELLVLRFAVSLPPERRLQRALLELDPFPRCDRRPGRIAIELAHVVAPWTSAELAKGRLPELSIPMQAAGTSATPERPLVLDVTEVVRAWQEHPGRYHGVAILAAGDSATGACYSSGVSWGRGPRLAVYLWPEDKDAGTDAGNAGDAAVAKPDAAADGGGGEQDGGA